MKKGTSKSSNTQMIIGVAAGAVAAGFVGRLIQNFNLPQPVAAAAPIVLGVVLSGQKNALVKGAGFGMIAKGSNDLVGALIPAAVSAPDVDDSIFMNGADDDFLGLPADQSILSLPADQSILSGNDDFTAEEMMMMGAIDDENEF